MKYPIRWICMIGLVVVAGCTTARSTPLNRSDQGSLFKASRTPAKGIPITIRVPTHVDVYVYEKYFLQQDAGELRQVHMLRPNLWVDVQTIETDKVVTVDWKRPLSGTLGYSAELGKDQYLDSIDSTITDTTITDVTATLEAVLATPMSADTTPNIPGLFEDNRVVAYRRFDLNAPQIEEQICHFVAQHLAAQDPILKGSPHSMPNEISSTQEKLPTGTRRTPHERPSPRNRHTTQALNESTHDSEAKTPTATKSR